MFQYDANLVWRNLTPLQSPGLSPNRTPLESLSRPSKNQNTPPDLKQQMVGQLLKPKNQDWDVIKVLLVTQNLSVKTQKP